MSKGHKRSHSPEPASNRKRRGARGPWTGGGTQASAAVSVARTASTIDARIGRQRTPNSARVRESSVGVAAVSNHAAS
ncbi:Uncharacterised protein [Mycobacteroides abscessus subsp. abscessus]|nr:Uncharacterised protein [Mycobacteroides abscessus subsp. abscessus]